MTTRDVNLPSKYMNEVINPWLLGADPEWAVVTPPDVVVPNSGQHAVNTTKPAGQIGSDHNGRVWELRPTPSHSAYVVTTNLWKLLKQAELERVEKFKWKSGGLGAKKQAPHQGQQPQTLQQWVNFYMGPNYGYIHATALELAHQSFQQQQLQAQQEPPVDTLGGHVHFDLQGLNPAQRTALNAVTTGLLNLDILPQKENSRRLALTANSNPKYGHFDGGDAVRECHGHVEYRCAPSWLDKPGQALACLTAYKLAAARPSLAKWPSEHALKSGFLEWLDSLASLDVDAWILSEYIAELGFSRVQADPSSDFKPLWRRDDPWAR